MIECFVAKALKSSGKIVPLILPSEITNGTSLFNPSVFVDGDKILLNLRHCQYTLYHSEKKKFEHEFGPLLYLNPENDVTLTTTNYLCELNPGTYQIESFSKVDTSQFDVKPLWEFIGLEDARVVRWNGTLYLSGVRRDTTPNGVGRMELSTIENNKEIKRWRIPAPGNNDTYCEKNWMPILDMPYHYVKWTNPTEIVKVDPITETCKTVLHNPQIPPIHDYRGGSQVVRIGNHFVALTHTVRLFYTEANKKDAIYRHSFIVWDENWNLLKHTKEFSFMNSDIEFCCGLAVHGDNVLISFGQSDNAAFVLSCPKDFIIDYLNEDIGE